MASHPEITVGSVAETAIRVLREPGPTGRRYVVDWSIASVGKPSYVDGAANLDQSFDVGADDT
jgi:hypothetical protein